MATRRIGWLTAIALCSGTRALAVPGYLSRFTATYPNAAMALDKCTLCHGPSGPPLNPYGSDFAAAGRNFAAIEATDSDGDGFSNITEIDAGTLPGNRNNFPGSSGGDNKRPVVRQFHIPRRADSLTVPVDTLAATDNVGVTGYLLTEARTPPPTATDPGWADTPPTSFTFLSSGKNKLFAWAKDAAGNVSRPKKRKVRITLP